MRTTYEAAWRLLDLLGNDRGPMLLLAASELRECLEAEGIPVSQPPAENPYFQETIYEVRD